jgi:hypothetical protein
MEIRNPNIETPAFAEAASRRQAKQFQNSNVQVLKFLHILVIGILNI